MNRSWLLSGDPDRTQRIPEWGRTKTPGSDRDVDMPSLLVAPLAQHLLRYPPLRSKDKNRDGGSSSTASAAEVIRRHVFRKAWSKACEAAGVGHVRPEWLRHTGASLAYAATGDMKGVATRLGHTSTCMVDSVYVELYAESSRKMADAIDADARQALGVGTAT